MGDPQLIAGLAPPLVGALAGYGGARLALLLLFKPRKPWRLFGLRLPLTPGAFALGRPRLAAAIGNALRTQPLQRTNTEHALSPHLSDQLRQHIARRTSALLHRDLGPIAALVPNRFRPVYEMGGKVARLRFQQLLHTHLDSPAFADSLRHELARHGIATGPAAEEVLGLLRAAPGKKLIDTLFADLVAEKVLAQPIGPLAKLVPADVQEGLDDLLCQEAETLLAELLPELLVALDLPALVTQRLEALDPLQYETLLRHAMARRANLLALLAAFMGLALGSGAMLLAAAI